MTDSTPPNPGGDPSQAPAARGFRRYLPKQAWQIALVGMFSLVTLGVIAVTAVALFLLPTLPSIDQLDEQRLKVPLRVYTADGQLIAEFGEEKRIPTKIDDVPEPLIQAILAAEDHSFLYHRGVDFQGILRAVIANLRTGTTSQGGSTITMQVARNYFLSPEKTYTRKMREVLLAFKLERELTKKEILELYVNKIFLGHRAYGFAAASQIYYGRDLKDLALHEYAMLAGLPKAPSRDNPLTNPQNALARRNYVLRQMHEMDFIDNEQLEQALAAPLTASKHAVRYEVEAPYVAEMVRQELFKIYDEKVYAGGFDVYTTIDSRHQIAATAALRKGIMDYERRHGYRGAAAHISVRGKPAREQLDEALTDYRAVGHLKPGVVVEVAEKSAAVYMQDGETVTVEWPGLEWARPYIDESNVGSPPKTASDVVRVGDIVYLEPRETQQATGEDGEPLPEKIVGGWWLAQVPRVSGAVVSMRPSDGAIVALAGGFDFYASSFNRVTQAQRQPGSSIKPFIWAAAMEKGFTPATTVSDAPYVTMEAALEDEWRPENYTRRFYGPTRLRKALAQSLNLVSIRLLDRYVSIPYAVDYLHERFGFDADKLPQNLSLALGTASVTPMQLLTAFNVFASGGFQVEPYFITRVEDADKNVVYRASPTLACDACVTQVSTPVGAETDPGYTPPRQAPRRLSPEVAFLMTSMMRDTIREGTGRAALALGRTDLAGKTGTTNEYRDAWFSGFNADLTAVAWVGFDQPASLGRAETGGRTALPIWIDYMREALRDVPEQPLVAPEGIVKVLVNKETGLPTDASDPDSMEEYFIKGTENAGTVINGETPGADTTTPVPPTETENVREKLF